MKNTINTLVVCCKEEFNKLKEEMSKITSEIQLKYFADNYQDALSIINDTTNEIDAIVVDGNLKDSNVLAFLTSYKNEYLLSRTIVLDNIKLDCYNLSASNYQLFNVIPKKYKVNELLYSLKEIKNKNEKYNYQKNGIMNTKSWMLLIFFLFASLLQLVAETSSEQQVVERALRLQYADVQYHPTFGGWYLLTTRHKGQVSYAMADAAGHIVVTGATDYKRHDAYIRFCFVDHEKKRLHEQWQKQWKEYEVAYANYCKVKDEYEQRLNAYNIQVEAVKLQANERYKQEVPRSPLRQI